MKTKIQKYLAGEREGFSLVELIIVIAIMAILIGVIALAVIPNIQRSRESKDLTTLDNIMSAANVGAANAKLTESITDKTIYDGKGGAYTATGNAAFDKAFKEAIGDGKIELGSTAATDGLKGIVLNVDVSSGAAKITVSVSGTKNPNPTNYDSGETSFFQVTN